MARLALYLLGPFRAEVGGDPVADEAWERPVARTLVKLLALAPGHSLHREQLSDLLWPDADSEAARRRFSKALHLARHALEPDLPRGDRSRFLQGDDLVRLVDVWVDVDAFEDLAARALRTGRLDDLDAALAVYGGDLLPGDRYADWAEPRRQRLSEVRARVSLAAIEAMWAEGNLEAALPLARALVEGDPLREEAQAALIGLYVAAGNYPVALRQYDLYREVLAAEMGTEPGDSIEALRHEAAKRGSQPARRALVPAAAVRLASGPLVGRERALEYLLGEMDSAARGVGTMVLVGGEAGVGKSRLVAELAGGAANRGVSVLWGAAYQGEAPLPYGPFVEAGDEYLASVPCGRLDALRRDHPEMVSLLTGGGVPEAFNRVRVLPAAVHFLDDLRAGGPLLLVLDDLHVADAETLQLVQHLARAARRRPWLLVATYRDEDVEPGGAFARMVRTGTRRSEARILDLGRMAADDLGALVRTVLSEGQVDPALQGRVYDLTLGNPLFAEEIVRAMRERGEIELRAGTWCARDVDEPSLPESIRALIEARVDAMGRDARRVLGLAAALGQEFSYAILRRAAGTAWPEVPEGTVLDVLDRALQGHILDERAGGYTFRHPMQRQALYDAMSQQRRRLLHTVIAGTVAGVTPDDVDALAHHYYQSGDAERAAPYVAEAADRAASVQALGTAALQYRRLLGLLDGMGRADDAARARERLGEVLSAQAQYNDALQVLNEAAEYHDARGNLAALALLVAQIGRIHSQRGTPDAGIRRIEALLARLGDVAPFGEVAGLYAALAPLLRTRGWYREQLAAADRAAEIARQYGDSAVAAEAEVWRGYAFIALGEAERGLEVLERAVVLTERAGDLGGMSRALNGIASVYSDWGEFHREREYLGRALDAAQRRGDPARIAFLTFRLGENALLTGDWNGAARSLEAAVSLGETIGDSWVLPYALCGLGALAAFRGERDTALRFLDRAMDLAQRGGDRQLLPQIHLVLAEMELDEGRPGAAVSRLDPLLHQTGEEQVTYLLPALARAQAAAGDRAAAEQLAEEAVRRAETTRNRYMLVQALRARGAVSAATGNRAVGCGDLEAALNLARTLSFPRGEAQVLRDLATVVVQEGLPREADEYLARAGVIFRRLGAERDASAVEDERAALRRATGEEARS